MRAEMKNYNEKVDDVKDAMASGIHSIMEQIKEDRLVREKERADARADALARYRLDQEVAKLRVTKLSAAVMAALAIVAGIAGSLYATGSNAETQVEQASSP